MWYPVEKVKKKKKKKKNLRMNYRRSIPEHPYQVVPYFCCLCNPKDTATAAHSYGSQ